MSEDEEGFLWVATVDGIARFDGFHFRNYRLPIVDSSQAFGVNLVDKVRCFQEQVWCMNRFGQLFRLDKRRDVFVFAGSLIQVETNKKYKGNIDFFFDLKRNYFWIIDNKKIAKYDPVTKQKEDVFYSKDIQYGNVLLDNLDRLWCSTEAGEVCFKPDTKSKIIFFETKVITAHCQKDTKIWCMGNVDTLYFIDIQTDSSGYIVTNAKTFFKNYKPQCVQDIIFAPKVTGDSLVWIATCGTGVAVVNIFTGKYSKTWAPSCAFRLVQGWKP